MSKQTLEIIKKEVDYHRNLLRANISGAVVIVGISLAPPYERLPFSTTSLAGLAVAAVFAESGRWQQRKLQASEQELTVFESETPTINRPTPHEPIPID